MSDKERKLRALGRRSLQLNPKQQDSSYKDTRKEDPNLWKTDIDVDRHGYRHRDRNRYTVRIPLMGFSKGYGIRPQFCLKSQVWSSGVSLYAMLCGRLPFKAEPRFKTEIPKAVT